MWNAIKAIITLRPRVSTKPEEVVSSVRFFTAQMKTFEDKALEQLKKQRQAKAELLTELSDSAKVEGEMKVLKVRLEAMSFALRRRTQTRSSSLLSALARLLMLML